MHGNPLSPVKNLDRAARQTRPNLLAQQRVRHRVVVLLDLDMIIEADPAFFPCRVGVGLGWQHIQGWPIKLFEQCQATPGFDPFAPRRTDPPFVVG